MVSKCVAVSGFGAGVDGGAWVDGHGHRDRAAWVLVCCWGCMVGGLGHCDRAAWVRGQGHRDLMAWVEWCCGGGDLEIVLGGEIVVLVASD